MDALQDPLREIADTARKVLEKTPPELISDIIDRGVALCGGGALLRGVDKYLTKMLGIPAYMVDEPTIVQRSERRKRFSFVLPTAGQSSRDDQKED